MSADEQPAKVPGMPLTMTKSALRGLLPLRFGRGLHLYFVTDQGRAQLTLTDSGEGSVQNFAATPAGWIRAWETAAAWARPAGFARALRLYEQRSSVRQFPLRSAQLAVELDAQMPLVLGALIFLGGHGGGDLLRAGVAVDLRRRPSAIALTDVGDGAVRYELAAAELTGAEAGGAGQVTTGGFAATAGHGLVGDLMNQAEAALLTEKLGRTEIRTNVRITGIASELFFRSTTSLPEDAQVALSAVRAMAGGRAAPPPEEGPALASPGRDDVRGGEDLVGTLERLARLRESGALTELEFQAAKQKLLG
jgi:hypothetical protein